MYFSSYRGQVEDSSRPCTGIRGRPKWPLAPRLAERLVAGQEIQRIGHDTPRRTTASATAHLHARRRDAGPCPLLS